MVSGIHIETETDVSVFLNFEESLQYEKGIWWWLFKDMFEERCVDMAFAIIFFILICIM